MLLLGCHTLCNIVQLLPSPPDLPVDQPPATLSCHTRQQSTHIGAVVF